MYECLPSKNPIKTDCTGNEVLESTDGVGVFLEDGSHEDGDIVVGCDGVASQVRQIMWYNANKATPNTITDGEMKCEFLWSSESYHTYVGCH